MLLIFGTCLSLLASADSFRAAPSDVEQRTAIHNQINSIWASIESDSGHTRSLVEYDRAVRALFASLSALTDVERQTVLDERFFGEVLNMLANEGTFSGAVWILSLLGPEAEPYWDTIVDRIDQRAGAGAKHRWAICDENRQCLVQGLSWRTGMHWYDGVCAALGHIDPQFTESRKLPESIVCQNILANDGSPYISTTLSIPFMLGPYMDESEMPEWAFN